MAAYEHAEEKISRPKTASFVECYESDGVFSFIFTTFGMFSVIVGFMLAMYTSNEHVLKTSYLLVVGGFLTQLALVIGYFMGASDGYEEFVKNDPNSKPYMFNFGREVYKHLGNAVKSMVKKNLTGINFLIDAEIIKRMGAIIGTTGSGKTVFLKGLMEQIILLGGACFTTDAKGTVDELKRTFALWWKLGVEKESFVLNFANPNNSHSVNLLGSGSALMIKEILSQLVENDDPKWKGVDVDFIEALLKLLVWKRDHSDPKIQEDLIPSSLVLYFSPTRILEEAWEIKTTKDIYVQDFVKYACTRFTLNYTEFIKKNDQEYYQDCVKLSRNDKLQGVYEIGLACGNWTGIMTLLGSNFGQIFNAKYPDIDLFESVQHNKNIWVVLPTVESQDSAKKLGKLLLGLIQSAAVKKIKTSFEPPIPYIFLLDEFAKFAVIGFGAFMSVSRSLGMAMWIFFQDLAQLRTVGEEEATEIMAMCNTLAVMKTKDADLAEEMAKFIPEHVELVREHNETRDNVDGSIAKEVRYNREKEAAIKPMDLLKQSNGEMHIQQGDKLLKGIACIPTDMGLTYKEKKISPKEFEFELMKVYPRQKLIEELKMKREELFSNNTLYNIKKAV
jgi:intracellular multiplication protein IcmO